MYNDGKLLYVQCRVQYRHSHSRSLAVGCFTCNYFYLLLNFLCYEFFNFLCKASRSCLLVEISTDGSRDLSNRKSIHCGTVSTADCCYIYLLFYIYYDSLRGGLKSEPCCTECCCAHQDAIPVPKSIHLYRPTLVTSKWWREEYSSLFARQAGSSLAN